MRLPFGTSFNHYLFGALLFFTVWPAMAQPKYGPTCPPHPITLGVYDFGAFYHAGIGLDKDVADLLQARSGCKFETPLMLRAEIWQRLQNGSLDMTLSAAATPERTVFSWAIPYLWIKNEMIINKGVDPNIQSASDFIAAPNLRLGVVRGHYPGKAYNDFVGQLRNIARVEETNEEERLFAMFKADRFQAMLASPLIYPTYLDEGKYRIEDWMPNGPRDSSNLLISKKNFSQDEAKRWAELMNTIINDGSLRSMLEKYVPSAEAAKMLTVDKGR